MNNNFYEYALNLINNMSVDELEGRLVDFGLDFKRKVSLYSEQEMSGKLQSLGAADPVADFDFSAFLPEMDFAANDNSYALAA